MRTVGSRTVSFAAVALLVPFLRAAQPWDTPFARDTRAILEAARQLAAPEDQPVVVLLEEHRHAIDKEGRTASTVRKVYRIQKEGAVEYWASAEQEYQLWYQEKPRIRARVIGGDGAVHWLDPKTIADSPTDQFDSTIYSDRRVARAPLPAVRAGSIVEYEVAINEKAPLLDAGATRRVAVMNTVPIERFRVLIDAHKAIALRTTVQLIPESAMRRETTDKGTLVVWEWGPIEPQKQLEFNLPPETSNYPYIAFATGSSWQAIAARYAGIVDQRIKTADLKSMLDGIDLEGLPLAVAARLTAKLHQEVRYTGVEFGEAEIMPGAPAQTLARKYGDCKDKSTLLIAMLRAAGLDAHLALLDAGFGPDVDEDLPGMGLFDHAIVHVASDPPLWIDATASDTRVGILPVGNQGRLALIARPETTALQRTPESQAADNWQRHTILVRFHDFGPGEFTETIEVSGASESQMRQRYAGDDKKAKEFFESYLKLNAGATLGNFEVTKKEDLSGIFRIKLEGLRASRVATTFDRAVMAFLPRVVFEELPFALKAGMFADAGSSENDEKPRRHDFLIPQPHVREYRYEIFPPPLFKVSQLPESIEVKLGSATYTRTFTKRADGSVEAVLRLDTGKRRLRPAEFTAFREGLRPYLKLERELITFVLEPSEHLAINETSKALALFRDHMGEYEDQAMAHARLSRMLVIAGLGGAARTAAGKATELDPNSGQAWQALGWAYQHDTFGRRFQGDWNLDEAERCYRKAIEVESGDPAARGDLAILLEHNRQGFRYGKGAKLDETIALYQEILQKEQRPATRGNLAFAMLHAGRWDDADEQIKKHDPQGQTVLRTVLTALREDPARAVINAQTSFPDSKSRANHLLSAAYTLMHLRAYVPAQTMINAAARLANSPEFQSLRELFGKMKRREDTLPPSTDARSPVQQLLLELSQRQPDRARLKSLFTVREDWRGWDVEITRLQKGVSNSLRRFASLGLSDEGMADFALSWAELRHEGEEGKGYAVSGLISDFDSKPTVFVVQEAGQHKILASTANLEPVGKVVLELLRKDDIEGAQWWLDRVVKGLRPDAGEPGLPAAISLWSGITAATRGPSAIRTAAATLIGRYTASDEAIQILKDAHGKAAASLEKPQLDLALCESLTRARKWDELLIVAKRLAGAKFFVKEGFHYAIKAARGSKRWADLEAMAQQQLATAPENTDAVLAMATAKAGSGDHAAAIEWIKKLIEPSLPYLDEQIFAAWQTMLAGDADQETLAELKKAQKTGPPDAKYGYTLAMAQASLGMPEDAQQSLRTAIDQKNFDDLGATPWAVYGKICELYGFPEEARAAYERARLRVEDGQAVDDQSAEWAVSLIPHAYFE